MLQHLAQKICPLIRSHVVFLVGIDANDGHNLAIPITCLSGTGFTPTVAYLSARYESIA